MRVQCNQCGKQYEVPASQLNRALKCLCKNTFIAQPIMVEVKETSPASTHDTVQGTPNEKPAENQHESTLQDEQSLETTVTAMASDEQIQDYISFLKSKKTEDEKTNTQQLNPSPPLRETLENESHQEIELSHDVTPLLEQSIAPSPRVENEMAILSKPSQLPTSHPSPIKKPSSQQTLNGKAEVPSYEKSKQASFLEAYPQVKWISAGFVVIAIAVWMVTFNSKKEIEAEIQDPYLAKLLEQKGKRPISEPEEKRTMNTPSVSNSESTTNSSSENQETDEAYRDFISGRFEDVIRKVKTMAQPSVNHLTLMLESLVHRADGDIKRLNDLLDEVKSLKNRMSDPLWLRTESFIRVYSAQKRAELTKPVEALASLSKTRPYDALTLAYLGMGLQRLGELELAATTWDRAISTEPDFVWLIRLRLDLARKSKQTDLENRMANALSQISGFESLGFQELSQTALSSGNQELAIDYLNRAARIDPSSELFLAIAKLQKDRSKEGYLKNLELVLQHNPKQSEKVEASLLLGRHYCLNENSQSARRFFQMALNETSSAKIATEKGDCEARLGLNVGAAESYEIALKKNEKDASVWFKYGQVLLKSKKRPAALQAFLTSLKYKESESARISAARILIEMNNKQAAQVHIRQILKANPSHREASSLLKNLN